MPISLQYNAETDILYVNVKGHAALEDFKSAIEQIVESDTYPPDVRTIWNVAEMDLTGIGTDFEKRLIAFRKAMTDRGSARIALVAPDDLAYGMSRMQELMSNHLPQELNIFRSMPEAEAWLLGE